MLSVAFNTAQSIEMRWLFFNGCSRFIAMNLWVCNRHRSHRRNYSIAKNYFRLEVYDTRITKGELPSCIGMATQTAVVTETASCITADATEEEQQTEQFESQHLWSVVPSIFLFFYFILFFSF